MKKYNKRELKKLTADNFYPLTDVMAKNLSAIYKLFGWDMNIEWLKEDGQPRETIDHLINLCLNELRKEKDTAIYATGGIKIEMYIDDIDEICLEVYYNIGSWE